MGHDDATRRSRCDGRCTSLASRTVSGRLWRDLSDEGALARTHAEHQAILAALIDRDPERARLLMAVHLLEVEDFMRSRRDAPAAVPTASEDPTTSTDRTGVQG